MGDNEPELGPLREFIDLPKAKVRINIEDMVFQEPEVYAKHFLQSHFIRYYLLTVKPSGEYTFALYSAWKEFLGLVNMSRVSSKRRSKQGGSYESFRKAMYILKTLGFIREIPPPVAVKEDKNAFPRVIYRITPSQANNPSWNHPRKLWDQMKAEGKIKPTGKPPCAPTLGTTQTFFPPPVAEKPKKARKPRTKRP